MGDRFILNGTKRWITNAGVSQYYTLMGRDRPVGRVETGILSVPWWKRDGPGVLLRRPPSNKLGIKGSPTRGTVLSTTAPSPRTGMIGP